MSSVCLFLLALLVIACLLWRNARRIAKVHLLYLKKGLPRKNETSDTTACRIYTEFFLIFLIPCNYKLVSYFSLSLDLKSFRSSLASHPLWATIFFTISFPCVNWFSTSCLRPPPCPLLFHFSSFSPVINKFRLYLFILK